MREGLVSVMRHNRVGHTDVHLSAVGFGTYQLQLVPERQAIDTLVRGFELGVNWVHTSHEYGGAEALIARAIARSGADIMVLNQASGEAAYVDAVFEKTCGLLGKPRLEMFGINCIDDAEFRGQNVWGSGGLVELLARKKREGRVGAVFCTTHGTPDYIARLITSGAFDAVMLPYNPLGFHVLSYFEEAVGREGEDIEQNRRRIFPLAAEHGVALLVMKPLAGGMLCHGKAFPPRQWPLREKTRLSAGEVLRDILSHPEVCAVVPGTASVEEAEENARAGHLPVVPGADRTMAVKAATNEMRAVLCSRCGACETSCSQQLRISFLFRDAYIWNYRSESACSEDYLGYFALHPETALACATCTSQTCKCPSGIDIPSTLATLHDTMLALKEDGRLPPAPDEAASRWVQGRHWALVISREVPATIKWGEQRVCRLWVHNSGADTWEAPDPARPGSGLTFGVLLDGQLVDQVPLRHDVESGQRTHLAFDLRAPRRGGARELRLYLMPASDTQPTAEATRLLAVPLAVEGRGLLPSRVGDQWRRLAAAVARVTRKREPEATSRR